eukprot:gnl/MRDRNA2_/MRDRNA2_79842_c0_seq2.p1 gnl/MRDRNA2_/MRDRNA2_79842_c0~~gnl/MRDRNA2_/MRDRNA2_79842_c0_seq2.p1  ORF type:complete len:592 (-),score=159.60 gnl/MRDRNA2_/MRDRNA2_79842_c0_seq2:2227-3864(-)
MKAQRNHKLEEQQAAATKLQSAYRGRSTRKTVKAQKERTYAPQRVHAQWHPESDIDGIYLITDLIVNHRPVYKSDDLEERGTYFIVFLHEHGWSVTDHAVDNPEIVYAYCEDFAQHPAAVTHIWYSFSEETLEFEEDPEGGVWAEPDEHLSKLADEQRVAATKLQSAHRGRSARKTVKIKKERTGRILRTWESLAGPLLIEATKSMESLITQTIANAKAEKAERERQKEEARRMQAEKEAKTARAESRWLHLGKALLHEMEKSIEDLVSQAIKKARAERAAKEQAAIKIQALCRSKADRKRVEIIKAQNEEKARHLKNMEQVFAKEREKVAKKEAQKAQQRSMVCKIADEKARLVQAAYSWEIVERWDKCMHKLLQSNVSKAGLLASLFVDEKQLAKEREAARKAQEEEEERRRRAEEEAVAIRIQTAFRARKARIKMERMKRLREKKLEDAAKAFKAVQVQLRILEARGLPQRNNYEKCDLYIVVLAVRNFPCDKPEREVCRTQIKSNTRDPNWSESFDFGVDTEEPELRLSWILRGCSGRIGK